MARSQSLSISLRVAITAIAVMTANATRLISLRASSGARSESLATLSSICLRVSSTSRAVAAEVSPT